MPPLKEQPFLVINTHAAPGFTVVQSMGITPFLYCCIVSGLGACKKDAIYKYAPLFTFCQQDFLYALSSYRPALFQQPFWTTWPNPMTLERLLHISSDVHDTSRTILGIDLRQILNSKER
jgi:hypothetical protein